MATLLEFQVTFIYLEDLDLENRIAWGEILYNKPNSFFIGILLDERLMYFVCMIKGDGVTKEPIPFLIVEQAEIFIFAHLPNFMTNVETLSARTPFFYL